MLPRARVALPMVPGVVEMVKGSASCQHSSVEAPWAAEMAVRLRNEGAVRTRESSGERSCSAMRMKREVMLMRGERKDNVRERRRGVSLRGIFFEDGSCFPHEVIWSIIHAGVAKWLFY